MFSSNSKQEFLAGKFEAGIYSRNLKQESLARILSKNVQQKFEAGILSMNIQ